MATATQTKKSPLQAFKDKYGAVVKLTDTIELHHAKAYNAAAEKHLMKEGQIDYKMLKDSKVRQQMADTMADTYLKQAQGYFKTDKNAKLSEIDKEMLLSAYHGITKGELRKLIEDSEDDFTLQQFHGAAGKLKQRIREKLVPSAYSHVTDSDKPGIIKAMGLEGKLDPDAIRIDELGAHMEDYHLGDGVIAPKSYNRTPAYKVAMKKAAKK
jgi:iron-sulfur cluster repair protein YtfE (RIC family)